LREKIGIAALNQIYDKRVPGALWHVRFFRDNEAEEYGVSLLPDGSGAKRGPQTERGGKRRFAIERGSVGQSGSLSQGRKTLDVSQWTLVDSKSEKKPNRVDHNLIWQENTPLDGTSSLATDTNHAFARVQVAVVGDEVTNFRTFIKIPDEWRRKQGEETTAQTLFLVFKVGMYAVLIIAGLVFRFLRRIKSQHERDSVEEVSGLGRMGGGGVCHRICVQRFDCQGRWINIRLRFH